MQYTWCTICVEDSLNLLRTRHIKIASCFRSTQKQRNEPKHTHEKYTQQMTALTSILRADFFLRICSFVCSHRNFRLNLVEPTLFKWILDVWGICFIGWIYFDVLTWPVYYGTAKNSVHTLKKISQIISQWLPYGNGVTHSTIEKNNISRHLGHAKFTRKNVPRVLVWLVWGNVWIFPFK